MEFFSRDCEYSCFAGADHLVCIDAANHPEWRGTLLHDRRGRNPNCAQYMGDAARDGLSAVCDSGQFAGDDFARGGPERGNCAGCGVAAVDGAGAACGCQL